MSYDFAIPQFWVLIIKPVSNIVHKKKIPLKYLAAVFSLLFIII